MVLEILVYSGCVSYSTPFMCSLGFAVQSPLRESALQDRRVLVLLMFLEAFVPTLPELDVDFFSDQKLSRNGNKRSVKEQRRVQAS